VLDGGSPWGGGVAVSHALLSLAEQGGGAVESCISHFVYALAFGSFLHLVFWFSSYHELGEKDAGQHVGYTVIFVQIGNMLMMADFLYYYFKRLALVAPVCYRLQLPALTLAVVCVD
jgi:ER lumen protein retaining receptor